MGDFNAHHRCWEPDLPLHLTNTSGRALFQLILDSPRLSLLSPPGLPTRYHPHTGATSVLDLFLGDPAFSAMTVTTGLTWGVTTFPSSPPSLPSLPGLTPVACLAGNSRLPAGPSTRRHSTTHRISPPFPWRTPLPPFPHSWRTRERLPSSLDASRPSPSGQILVERRLRPGSQGPCQARGQWEDFFRVEASSSDVTQERERNISGSSGSVDIPTISRSSSLMSLGSEPEDSRPGTQASDQVDVVIAGGCSISSQELQTIKDKMAALTNYYKLSHVIKSKNAPDTSSKVLGKTIKVYNLKAKCQKCFAEVSFWNNTPGNLVSHYKTKHTHDLSELKAAISRTSRRGLKHPSGDDQPQRHQF
ncbi:hypothetical protein GWK47_043392 [Chionoecetes opilio]|uniref:Endonuclease/exonuclease/phosphatase domain-containing protein n=1 Tax=Chionoecetes opilio TaxID=41210 RepID=A0A8J4Y9F1_CHIOP|nr:hypothetical protein GWK47_043392 [Chionoecetes opilio]